MATTSASLRHGDVITTTIAEMDPMKHPIVPTSNASEDGHVVPLPIVVFLIGHSVMDRTTVGIIQMRTKRDVLPVMMSVCLYSLDRKKFLFFRRVPLRHFWKVSTEEMDVRH